MKRTRLGIIALGCLLAAGGLYVAGGESETARAMFIRVGIVLAAMWWAYPQIEAWCQRRRYPAWTVIITVAATAALIRYMLLLLPLFAALFVLTMFLPKPKKAAKSDKEDQSAAPKSE